jgi:hypothetical protein
MGQSQVNGVDMTSEGSAQQKNQYEAIDVVHGNQAGGHTWR